MAKIHLELDFEIIIPADKILPPANHISIGVSKESILYESDYSKGLTTVASGMQANVMDKSRQFKDANERTQTTTNVFRAIWKEGKLLPAFYAIMNKKADDLVNAWYVAEDDQSLKRAQNSMLAMLRQAYKQIAKSNSVGEQRAKQKGFSERYIGTGQTYKALGASVIKPKQTAE